MKQYKILLVCWLPFLAGVTNAENYDPAQEKYTGPSYIEALVNDSNILHHAPSEDMFGVDITLDNLLNIDKETAAATIIGSVTSPIVGGLAYNPETKMLFGTDTKTRKLVAIDPCDGTTIVIGNTGIPLAHGLALDSLEGTLYATDGQSNLYVIDETTAEANLVGPIGYSNIGALDFDPTTGILYGAYAFKTRKGFLITIDTTTGQGSFIADTHRINGLCFDEDGNLFASDNGLWPGTNSSLYTVDKFTGQWSRIGSIGMDNVLCVDLPLPSTPPIEAEININPNILNLKSSGKWITCYIWLPEDYNVAEIEPNSVLLENEPNAVAAEWMWFESQEDVAMAKFSRSEVLEIVDVNDVKLTVTGELTDGTRFEGTDTIKVIDKGGKK